MGTCPVLVCKVLCPGNHLNLGKVGPWVTPLPTKIGTYYKPLIDLLAADIHRHLTKLLTARKFFVLSLIPSLHSFYCHILLLALSLIHIFFSLWNHTPFWPGMCYNLGLDWLAIAHSKQAQSGVLPSSNNPNRLVPMPDSSLGGNIENPCLWPSDPKGLESFIHSPNTSIKPVASTDKQGGWTLNPNKYNTMWWMLNPIRWSNATRTGRTEWWQVAVKLSSYVSWKHHLKKY